MGNVEYCSYGLRGNTEQTSLMAHWWSVYNTGTLTAEQTASVGLNVMMTPCWENHGRVTAVSWTAIKQVLLWVLLLPFGA